MQHFYDVANYKIEQRDGNEAIDFVRNKLGEYFKTKEKAAQVNDVTFFWVRMIMPMLCPRFRDNILMLCSRGRDNILMLYSRGRDKHVDALF